MSLGTFERDIRELEVAGQTIRNVGVGIGAVAAPLAIVASTVMVGYFFSNYKDEIEDWLDPNTGDANEKIDEKMTDPSGSDDGEPSPFGKYLATKAAEKDQREAAFLEGAGEGGVESSPAVWAQYKAAHPLVRVMSQDDGTTNSAVYQIAIRATAGRRYFAGSVPLIGAIATLVGVAMPGEYYMSPDDAEGYIADPLLDLLALRTIGGNSWRVMTITGAGDGEQIERDLNMPWVEGVGLTVPI